MSGPPPGLGPNPLGPNPLNSLNSPNGTLPDSPFAGTPGNTQTGGSALATILGDVSKIDTHVVTKVANSLKQRGDEFKALSDHLPHLTEKAKTAAQGLTGSDANIYQNTIAALTDGDQKIQKFLKTVSDQLHSDASVLLQIVASRTQIEHDGAANVKNAAAEA